MEAGFFLPWCFKIALVHIYLRHLAVFTIGYDQPLMRLNEDCYRSLKQNLNTDVKKNAPEDRGVF